MRITRFQTMGRRLILAVSALSLAALLAASCSAGSGGESNSIPGGPGGGSDIPPVGGTLTITPATETITVPAGDPGGEVVNFFATGGIPPYIWDINTTLVGYLTPIDEFGDQTYRKASFTVNSPITATGDTDIIVRDNDGHTITATVTLEVE